MVRRNETRFRIFHGVARFISGIVFPIVHHEEQEAEAGSKNQESDDGDSGEQSLVISLFALFGTGFPGHAIYFFNLASASASFFMYLSGFLSKSASSDLSQTLISWPL